MVNAIATRLATPLDIAAVATLFDLYRQFYEQESNLQLATEFIQQRIQKNESVVIVAEYEGRIVGFSQLYPTFCSVAAKPVYALYDLFVVSGERKSGIGRALLLTAEQHAAQNGFARLDLTTAKTNFTAQSLYESLGWIRDEVFYAYSRSVQG